jgi:hypothetical protein
MELRLVRLFGAVQTAYAKDAWRHLAIAHRGCQCAPQQRLALDSLLLFFPCSRVLEDRFGANLLGMMVLKGQAARLAYISEFIEQAKASGLVQQAIERAGVRGVQVAPGKAN